MISRYSKEKMANICSDKAKFINWVKVEAAVLSAKVKVGELKAKVPETLPQSINIIVDEINRIEREETKQDVIAFLIHTSKQLPEELRPYWHDRMTSYDTQDTALSLQLRECIELLQKRVNILMNVIKEKALMYKYTAQIGRTHGVHAEPITFGVKLANWYDEFRRHIDRLERLRKLVSVGKISGAVGMYTLDPQIEKLACKSLGLEPIIATQIISRDIIAEYLSMVAILGGTIGKICVNIRTLQRTEILEAQEYFSKTQRGSSAMPHKRNPIGAENLSGMARVLHGYAMVGFENQNTWDERDLSNSGPERIILPDASILLDYMLDRLVNIIDRWVIYPEKMWKNLDLTKGLIFSQDVQSLVAQRSMLPREEAYKIVCDIAQSCWNSRLDFLEELLESNEVMKYVSKEELKNCFNIQSKLKYVNYIFEKVFE